MSAHLELSVSGITLMKIASRCGGEAVSQSNVVLLVKAHEELVRCGNVPMPLPAAPPE